ncbi:MAG: hypothetical protein ACP5IE_07525 [Infirmifilum sp.]
MRLRDIYWRLMEKYWRLYVLLRKLFLRRLPDRVYRIIGVASMQVILWWRRKSPVGQLFGFLLGMLFFVGFWGGPTLLRDYLIASFIAGGWSLGSGSVARILEWDWATGQREVYVASPLTFSEYLLGILISLIPALIFEIWLPLALILMMDISISSIPWLFTLALISLVLGMLATLAIAPHVKPKSRLSIVTNPVTNFILMLSPVFYPLSLTPWPMRPLLLLFPVTPLGEAARIAAGGYMSVLSPLDIVFLVSFWIAVLTLAVSSLHKWGFE